MKAIFTSLILLFCISVSAQEIRWNVNLDPQKVFIENKSQFNGRNDLPALPVLFATEDGRAQILFSKAGVTYHLEKREHPEMDDREEREEGMTHEELERKEREVIITDDFVQMQWKNSNPDVEVVALDPVSFNYNYKTRDGSIAANAYRKIVYRNLYPHIDVEYVFHPVTGIEYSFLLHPGADPSNIQMNYFDVGRITIDGDRNIHLPTQFGDIIDHAPHTFYADNHSPIESKFARRGKTISFEFANYDATQEVIIDPWTVSPAMGNSNKVFNIDADSLGNAYIYGGDSPYKLQKYDPAGALQWTFTNGWDSSSYWCGTLIVDRPGNSYITAGSTAEITKVNTGGSQVWTNSGGFVDEYWSMVFNCDESELIVGGTRLTGIPIPNGSGRAYNINLTNGAVINSIKVSNAIPAFIINDPNEIRSICGSPNGNYYFLTLDTIGGLTPAIASIVWESVSGYRFGYGSPDYGFTPQGQSIIRATMTHIYTCNGDSIVKRDINTGAIVAGAAIPGGGHTTTLFVPGTLPKNGGLIIDSCGFVYVGSQANVTKYDDNLNFISSTPTPSAVYDVAIGINGDVLACGNGFAVALNIPSCSQIHLACTTTVAPVAAFTAPNTICPGTCTGFTNQSINATSYQWYFAGANPPTSTDVDPLNICYNTPGTYDVTLVATGATGSDSVTLANYVTVYPYPPPQGIVQSFDTLFANQGSVSYQWYQDGNIISGATDYFYIITSSGNFNVVCTDSNGCEVEAVIFDVIEGITSVDEAQSLSVYPNPVGDELKIYNSKFKTAAAVIKIYNVLSEEVMAAQSAIKNSQSEMKVNVSGLTPGIYWVEVMVGEKKFRTKIVKE